MSSGARTPDQIAADIAETRNRLAGTIDQLVYRAQPKTIAKRKAESLKARFVDEQGHPKLDQILKVSGIAVGILAVVVAIRKIAS
ncbi:MAG: DUF3618 domain-containing protein [Nocardioidaceae bacterium]